MKKKLIIALVILLIIGISVFFVFKQKNNTNDSVKNAGYKLTTEIEEYKTQNEEGTTISNNEITKVTITNNSKKSQASKIEKSINEKMNVYWDRVKEAANEMIDSGFYDATIENLDYGVSIKASEYSQNKNNYIIEVTEKGAFSGTEWGAKFLFNYNPSTGELLKLKDITNNYEEFQKAVIKEVKDYLNKEYDREDLFLDDIKDNELFAFIEEDGNWAITSEGLVVIFQKNDIAPSSTGAIEINVDLNNLKEYIKNDYHN